jgi:integrase
MLDPVTGLWNVMVYQRKTGDPVYCPIPPHVADVLNTIPASQKGNANERYFFWTGEGLAKTITSNWQRSYKKLFSLVGLKNQDGTAKRCHPHMLRDTFAVEAILSEMPVQRVSEILGHSSIRVTEKHYLPWVRARQKQLNDAVVESWKRQGVYVKGKPRPGKKAAVVKFPKAG